MSYSHPPNRLASFSVRRPAKAALKWPFTIPKKIPASSTIHPHHLSNAGFYYTPLPNLPTRTTCYLCHLAVDEWKEGDNPIERHLSDGGEHECGWAMFVKVKQEWDGKLKSKTEWEKHWGASGQWWPKGVKLEEYRKMTFEAGWPHTGVAGMPTVDEVVAAGWFFTPSTEDDQDCVTCPYCHRSVSLWDAGDDATAQHNRKLGANCPFFLSTPPKALALALAAAQLRGQTEPSHIVRRIEAKEEEDEDEFEEDEDETGGIRLVESRRGTPVKKSRPSSSSRKFVESSQTNSRKGGKKAVEKNEPVPAESQKPLEAEGRNSQASHIPATRSRRGTNDGAEAPFSQTTTNSKSTRSSRTASLRKPSPSISTVVSPPTRSTRGASVVTSPALPPPPLARATRAANGSASVLNDPVILEDEEQDYAAPEPELAPTPVKTAILVPRLELPQMDKKLKLDNASATEVDPLSQVPKSHQQGEVRMEVEEEMPSAAPPKAVKKSKSKSKSSKASGLGSKNAPLLVHEDPSPPPGTSSRVNGAPSDRLPTITPYLPRLNPFKEPLPVSLDHISAEEKKMSYEEFLDKRGKAVVSRAREQAERVLEDTQNRMAEGRQLLVALMERKKLDG